MTTEAHGLEPVARRAEELFELHRKDIFESTDRLFARLMLLQWLAGIFLAIFVSPKTWAGQSSSIHLHVWMAIYLGGAISLFPIWLTRVWPGSAFTRYTIAVAQMLMSALLIDLTGGRLETHFHVFGSLVILSFYRDWRVLVPATIIVALDHFLLGIFWPYSVYGVLSASPWRSVEHAGWVIFEDVFLVISCLRSIREMRSIANRTAQMEASEERFRQLAENIEDVFWMTDPVKEEMIYISPAYERIWGRKCDELYESPASWQEPIHEEDRQRVVDAAMSKQIRGEYDEEYRIVHPDGSLRWIKDRAFPIRDKTGRVYRIAGIAEDITERKCAQESLKLAKENAEKANHAKSDFLSRMSHELRTPLNAILGFSQLIERQNATPVQRGRLAHIINAGRHLLNLIDEILDISRIEAGRLQLSLEPVCLQDVFQETMNLVLPIAAQREVELAPPSLPDRTPHVMADRQRLTQVLLNLVTNAIKYGPAGGVVTLTYAEETAGHWRLSVMDQGPGIPSQKLTRLFVPFDRLDAETSEVQGTGLGLALSKRLAEAMGGTMGATSTSGEGSTFWVELPAAASPVRRLGLADTKPDSLTHQETKRARTILYVEDNLSNLTLIQEILQEQPEISLITAMQGRLGMDLAREHLPDLILLDLHLPDLPGWEVLAELRATEATRTIPVIVISADATSRQIARLKEAGAHTYLTKPLDVPEFLRALDETSNIHQGANHCLAV